MNSQSVRPFIIVGFLLGIVYLLYLYNNALGRERDAKLSAEGYRRGEETKYSQLQVMMQDKFETQETCKNEKVESSKRLDALKQNFKMLKSQCEERETEQFRLENLAKKAEEDFNDAEVRRNTEYQLLKQEKDLEISTLRDQVANGEHQNEQLRTQISLLASRLEEKENELSMKTGEITDLSLQLQKVKVPGMMGPNKAQYNIRQQVPVQASNQVLHEGIGREHNNRRPAGGIPGMPNDDGGVVGMDVHVLVDDEQNALRQLMPPVNQHAAVGYGSQKTGGNPVNSVADGLKNELAGEGQGYKQIDSPDIIESSKRDKDNMQAGVNVGVLAKDGLLDTDDGRQDAGGGGGDDVRGVQVDGYSDYVGHDNVDNHRANGMLK